MRYVILKIEKIYALELAGKNANNLIRNRSQCFLFSNQGRTIIDLANIFDIDRRTLERLFDKWEIEGMNSLPNGSGRGVKARLKDLEESD